MRKTATIVLVLLTLLLSCEQGRAGQYALQFNGKTNYVTFGAAPTLGASNFTLECWFKRLGAGKTTSTGSGGLTATPLIAKGRGEQDGDNRDCNYFFGIDTNGLIIADFEEGGASTTPGLNHPVAGQTVIQTNQWYHGAVTFDGTNWALYLNGLLCQRTVKTSQLGSNENQPL